MGSPPSILGSSFPNSDNHEPSRPQTTLPLIDESESARQAQDADRYAGYCQALLIAGFEAFDQLGIGLVIASGDDQFFYANRVGQMILQQQEYTSIDRVGILPTSNVSQILDPGAKQPPFQQNPCTSLKSILLLAQPVRSETPYSAMAEIFGLTFTESRLAHLLMKGLALSDCREEMGISSNTVAFHMKNLFRKTKTSGQNHLISALFRSIGIGALAKDSYSPIGDRKLARR